MAAAAPGFEALREQEKRYLMSTFARVPVELVRGEGWKVYDETGREYLDFVAGIAVNILGHAHPAVVAAIREQAGTLVHTSNLYYTSPQVELARELVGMGFAGRAFFANSGAEANEAAVKCARKWGKLNRDGAYEVISTDNSFHGRTLAMVAATGQKKFKAPVEPMPDGFLNIPFNDIGALRAAVSKKTVAILLEPIQGEGGIIPATGDYLRAARELCDQENLLLILDEIQTGMGRTGTFFAFEGYGVLPDIVTLAKGLGGGVPIGACLANARADVFTPGDHGGTFGGNPLACAAALATLRALRSEGVIANAADVGAYLAERLGGIADDFDCVAEVRGRGLMQAIVFDRDIAPRLQAEALVNGLIVNASSERVLRFIPPLIIGRPEVDRAVEILSQCIDLVLGEVAP